MKSNRPSLIDWSVLGIGLLFGVFVDLSPLFNFFGLPEFIASRTGWLGAYVSALVVSSCNGVLAGVALFEVSPRSVARHAAITMGIVLSSSVIRVTLLLMYWKFLVGSSGSHIGGIRIELTPIILEMVLNQVAWFLGAISAATVLRRGRNGGLPMRHVVFHGLGDAWEPMPRRALALFFVSVLALTMLGDACNVFQVYRAVNTSGQAVVSEQEMGIPSEESKMDKSKELDGVTDGLLTLGGYTLFIGPWLMWKQIGWMGLIALIRRCFPTHASTVLSTQGSHFVWLRPFDVDGLPQTIPRRRDLFLNNWKSLFGRSIEQRVNRCFIDFAGLVAIGRPGDKLPPLGAGRLYVEDEQWKSLVQAFVQSSSGVLLHTAKSQGTLWEWQQALQLKERRRIIFFIPVRGTSGSHCEQEYQRLRKAIESQVGTCLPKKWEASLVAFFDTNESPHAQWLQRKTKLSLSHPLHVVLARLAKIKHHWRIQSLVRLGVLLAILFVISACFLGLILLS